MIKRAFLVAVNRFIGNNSYHEEFMTNYFPLIGDTTELEKELEDAINDKKIAIKNIEHLIAENAMHAQAQDLYDKSYNALRAHIKEKQLKDIDKNFIKKPYFKGLLCSK